MPLTYGAIITPDRGRAVPDKAQSAQTPLLGGPSGRPLDDDYAQKGLPEGTAGIMSSIVNLSNTILGTGILAFPLAMASSGLIPGILTCVFSGGLTALGLWFLSRCASQCPPRQSSFFAVANLTYPSLAVFSDAAIAIKCFGVSVSYLVIIKGLMPSVVRSLHFVSHSSSPLPWWTVSGRFWITASLSVLVPLCLLKRLDSLRHTSYVALFSVAYLVVIVVVCYFKPPKGSPEPGEWHLVHFTPSFISALPVQAFAFTCAMNFFSIYNELAWKTQTRMNLIIGSSLGGTVVTHEVISIFGYITFGSNVGPNIMAMYPSTTLFIALGQFAIVLLVLFSYPLQVHPCRSSLDKIFTSTASPSMMIVASIQEGDEEEEVDLSGVNHTTDMKETKRVVLTGAIVFAGFMISYFVDDLQMILSFVGSTGSTTISFILPGLLYYKLFGTRPDHPRILTWASIGLTGYGVLIFIFCLTYNIWNVVHKATPAHFG